MGDLQQVDSWQAFGHEAGIDALLDVAGQEEPGRADRPQEDDRAVVDRRALVGGDVRDRSMIRPEHTQLDRVEADDAAAADSLDGALLA